MDKRLVVELKNAKEEDIIRRFKKRCAMKERTMKWILLNLIESYLRS